MAERFTLPCLPATVSQDDVNAALALLGIEHEDLTRIGSVTVHPGGVTFEVLAERPDGRSFRDRQDVARHTIVIPIEG